MRAPEVVEKTGPSTTLRVLYTLQDTVRLRGPLAGDLTARVLHNLLLWVLCWGFLQGLLIVPLFTARRMAAAGVALFVESAVAFALILLRRGHLRTAGAVYLFGTWMMATAIVMLNRGIFSVALIYCMTLPVTGAWLFGFRAALAIAGFGTGSFLYFAGTPLGQWAIVLAWTIITIIPVARVLELLKDALAREQFAQAVLSESHRDLEELMQRRTLELVDAREAAHAAMRAKTVFLANMSHELRTPLHAILGFSTLVRSGPGLSEDQRKDLDIVRRSGEQLLDLIDEVLDLSNSESGAVVRNADFAEGSETAGGVSADDEVTGLAPGQPEYRILIVEEQGENSRLLERLLQNAGFRVNLAENGLEGIEACRIWHPHLVWMDLGLSGMSCVETARRMRLLEGGQQVKIVALTTSALGTGRDGMPASGLDDVVRKPCRRREIFDCMERMLGVTYNYGKRAPLAAAEMGAPLTPEALSALPEELCGELEDALISLDVDRVTSLTSRVAESYPRLGGIMTSLSNNLAYTTLLRAIAARKVDLVVDRP